MSAIWGPLYFLFDSAPVNQITGIVLVCVLGAGMIAFPLWPRKLTGLMFILAVLLWLISGVIGEGINC